MNKKVRLGRWGLMALSLLGALLAALALTAAAGASQVDDGIDSPAYPTAGLITGLVTEPGGGPPPAGTWVKLWRPDGSLAGQAAVDPASGAFSLGPAPNGNYILRAVPPELSPLTPSFPRPVHVTGGSLDLGEVALTWPSLSGVVTAPDGSGPAEAWVGLYRPDGQLVEGDWAPGGQYRLGGVLTGTYLLKAKPAGDDPYWWSSPVAQPITPTLPQTADLQLTHANVYGTVESPSGNPMPDAVVQVLRLDGMDGGRDESSLGGYFAIGGLSPGIYLLRVEPPYWRADLLPTLPLTFTLPPSQTDVGALQLRSSPKLVQGAVQSNLGGAVEGALVLAHRVNAGGEAQTLSGADGGYQLRLSAGTWALTVRPVSSTVPADWVYPLPPQLVHFAYNEEPEIKGVNFEVLTADSQVTGRVALPGGSPPPFSVTVQLRSSEGVGAGQVVSPDGSLNIALPHGDYQVWVASADPQYVGPPVPAVHLPPSTTLDLGPLTLIPRDALITGTVTDPDGNPVPEIRVTGWTRGHVYGEAWSGPDGRYTMAVISGTWSVNASPSPEQPYVCMGSPQAVTVASGGTAPEVDFELTPADATIRGVLFDPAGEPALEAFGWAGAGINGAPIQNGQFSIPVPAGSYSVSLTLAENSPYLAPKGSSPVSLGAGETATLVVTVREKDAAIQGALWDPRSRLVVTGVPAQVTAWSDWAMLGTAVDPGNGAFRLPLSADLWHLAYRLDPAAAYAQLSHRLHVPVQSGQVKNVGLPVAHKDSELRGVVLDPVGNPISQTLVIADGIGWGVQEVTIQARPDAQGQFRLKLPHGIYNLRAVGGLQGGWLNPTVRWLLVPPDTVVPNLALQFQQPDAVISGSLSLEGTPPISGAALIWGWSPAGAYSQNSAELGGVYTLQALSHSIWQVGGVFETETAFWAGRERVVVGEGGAHQDLLLQGPYPKPAPVAVSWEAADPQYLALADGTSIYLPAGSLPVSGTVTLHIVPIAALPHQPHANIYKYGWAFEAVDSQGQAITSQFNQNVVIAFQYRDEELLQWGIEEAHLKPAYFSTGSSSWCFPDSYVVDPLANRVVMQIDHFTHFALVAAGETAETVYLPALVQ